MQGQTAEQKNFNPRSREGSDYICYMCINDVKISIHAPARGATSGSPPLRVFPVHFNPRSREGSDFLKKTKRVLATYFNPRSREGSDFLPALLCDPFCNFNPRSREGSDGLRTSGRLLLREISIHAPARGATC